MTEFLPFLIEHGYIVIFIWVFLDQSGLPLPAIPVLLAAGVLIGLGEMSLTLVLLLVLLGSVPVDLFWYWLGRLRGARVLHLLCILSMEPDYCVRNTENVFRKLGPVSLVIGKFVPQSLYFDRSFEQGKNERRYYNPHLLQSYFYCENLQRY